MKKEVGVSETLYPMPVLMVATYDENGAPDVMAAAWACIADEGEVFLCISPTHKTAANLQKNKAFTVSPAPAKLMKECDYLGIASANKVSGKLAKVGFHATKSAHVNAPLIDEFPYTLECELISYDNSCGKLFARIVNIVADESVLTGGKIDPKKLEPITFDSAHHKYIKLGDAVGDAFSCGKEYL